MANLLQHGQHPDADQLNAFMEKALPERERLATLAHLAECAECRDTVFLAQKDLLPEVAVAAQQDLQPGWKAWWRPVPVASIAFGCLFLLAVSVGVHKFLKNPGRPVEDAKNVHSAARQIQITPPNAQPETAEPAEDALAARKSQETIATPMQQHLSRGVPKPSASQPAGGLASGVAGGVAGGILGGIGAAPGNETGKPRVSQFVAPPQMALAVSERSAEPAENAAAAAKSAPPTPAANPPTIGHDFAALRAVGGPMRLTVEHGQSANSVLSELRGTVRDPSGAIIPKATITVRGLSGQANSSATSDAAGAFTLAALPPGQYEIQIAAIGFQPLTQRIDLQAKDVAQIDPVLPVGSLAQTVEITGAAPVLQKESVEISSVRKKSHESTFVSQVALNGTVLAFDTNGNLFRKGEGDKNWKKVKPKWHGAVIKLSLDPDNQAGGQGTPAAAAQSFLITTGSGDTWASPDGRHWKQR